MLSRYLDVRMEAKRDLDDVPLSAQSALKSLEMERSDKRLQWRRLEVDIINADQDAELESLA